ncbi:collagen alpha-2(I) chain-like isoform X3 [Anas acuta]|uniref:collagen alpha-2(I) chain-like isoform X3 n=1 Tax=Anas acuta TaxID=28680 RepID=UPI0035C8EB89
MFCGCRLNHMGDSGTLWFCAGSLSRGALAAGGGQVLSPSPPSPAAGSPRCRQPLTCGAAGEVCGAVAGRGAPGSRAAAGRSRRRRRARRARGGWRAAAAWPPAPAPRWVRGPGGCSRRAWGAPRGGGQAGEDGASRCRGVSIPGHARFRGGCHRGPPPERTHPPSTMVLGPGRRPNSPCEDGGPPHCQPTMKCCSHCPGSGVPDPDARPPTSCGSPSCCLDPRGGCTGSPLPCPGPAKHPGSPSASARSAESLGGSVGSADAASSAGSASLKPGVEEALGTMLAASCTLSPKPASALGPAIDRSFITTSLAAQMLEEFLTKQVPAAATEVSPDVPEESNRQGPVAPTASLERLRRHNRRFQRAKARFQGHGEIPVQALLPGLDGGGGTAPRHGTRPEPRHGPPWDSHGCRGQGGEVLCRGTTWHAMHGCCGTVEVLSGACPWERDGGAAACRECGCSWGLPGPPVPPVAPVPQRDVHGWATHTTTACTTLGHESRSCQGAATAMLRAGRVPHCEPPADNQGPPGMPSCSHAEPGTSALRGCGCPPRCSRGRSVEEPRREPDGERSRLRRREPAGTLARGRDPGGEPEGPVAWAPPQQRLGAMNTVQLIAKTFELRAQRDAAQAERDRQPPFCRRGGTLETCPPEPRGPCSPGCCRGLPRARGSLPPECSRARGAAQPCCGCKARGGPEGAGCIEGERSGRSQR